MQFLKKYPLLILFAVFLYALTIASLLTPPREDSVMENRKLAQKPKLTVSSLLAVRTADKYTQKYETFMNDQFIGRDGWITLKSICESALGKIENNGVVYGRNGYMFDKFTSLDERRLNLNIQTVTEFVNAYGADTPVTVAIVPNSYQTLEDELPAGLDNINQAAEIEALYKQIPEAAHKLDLLPVMRKSADAGQAYYRTDHHWTTRGAYAAYHAFVSSRGLQAADWDQLASVRRDQPGFYGTYYNKCKLFSAKPDTIEWYDIPIDSMTIAGKEMGGMYDMEKWDQHNKYDAFLWSNNDLTIIRSQNNLNHEEGKTTRILLIKDSYGNSFAPFLTYSYDEVWVVDPRFLMTPMSELMTQNTFDDVLILYNFKSFAEDSNIYTISK